MKKKTPLKRIKTGVAAFDEVLGGGLVPGAVVVLTGWPGSGKTTLALKVANKVRTIYASEQSYTELDEIVARLRISTPYSGYELPYSFSDIIRDTEEDSRAQLVVVDTINAAQQIKKTVEALHTFAKKNKVSVILVARLARNGAIAGSKIIEERADVVLRIAHESGDDRELIAEKNRYGKAGARACFSLTSAGIRSKKSKVS